MKVLTTIAGCFSAVLYSGCATTPFPLKPSTASDAAKVRFISKISGSMIDLYPSNECNHGMTVVHNDSLAETVSAMKGPPQRAGMLDPVAPKDYAAAEFAIAPGQVINVGVIGGVASCIGGRSFLAAPSAQYEVVLTRDGDRGCRFTISELVKINGTAVSRRPVNEVAGLICRN